MAPPLTGLSLVSPLHPSSNGLTPLNSSIGLKAMLAVLPPEDDFPYTVRINSEVMASDGSTSMATVCGGILFFLFSGNSFQLMLIAFELSFWEIYVQLQESVRGCDVFLLQPTCPLVNENLMELEVMIDACRRDSAKNITVVTPYFGYARADRKTQGRESIAAKLVANLITEAGANRLLACDIHSGQSLGYFDIAVDHVYCEVNVMKIYYDDLVVVSPDVGGVARAHAFAKTLSDAPLAIVGKRCHGHNIAELAQCVCIISGVVAVEGLVRQKARGCAACTTVAGASGSVSCGLGSDIVFGPFRDSACRYYFSSSVSLGRASSIGDPVILVYQPWSS
ncbi:hypothetical protein UlMin_022789 [Ulmus minor]